MFLSLLSCGREVTGPDGGLRFADGLSFIAEFPGEMASVETGAGSVVPYTSVRVLLTRSSGTVALARVFPVSSDVAEFEASLQVPLSPDAPAEGEPLALHLQYINAAGDTVFRGGPVSVLARQLRRGEQAPQPVPVPLTYTGPGAQATAVGITPDTIAVEAGSPFSFGADALDGQGATVANAPLVFSSLDADKATITALGAGAGLTLATRGVARVRVALAAGGAADTGILVIAPRPSALSVLRAPSLTGVVGSVLADSIVLRLLATDGLPIEGAAVAIAIAGGGTLNDSSLVTDADGRIALLWTLGPTIGAQTITATTAGVAALTVTATGAAALLPARTTVITAQPTTGTALIAWPPVTVEARDSTGALATTFNANVALNVIEAPSGGTVSGPTGIVAASGVAVFNGLSANRAGAYRFTVTGVGLLPDTSGVIVVSAGAPSAVTATSGTGQSANINSLVPNPIVVRVADGADNPVPNAVVTFAVATGGGALTGAVDTTDANGLATLGSWTLGATVGAQSITATVSGVTPLTITATGFALAPTITLGIVSSNVIGFGRTGPISVRLGQPAPVGGLTVTVQSDSTQYLTVAAPGTVTFAAGDTLGSIDVTGVAVGVANVRAGAPGWEGDTIAVPVSLNLISLPATLNVPLTGSASLPVQLSTTAPVGGVNVALSIANPSVVGASPNPVTIPAGGALQNSSISGLQLGSTTITATHPNYAPAVTTVTVTAGVDITATSLSLNQSFGATMTVRLVSGGNPVPAPVGGIALDLTSLNTACAEVPATATIAAGFTSVNVTVTAGNGSTFPCATTIRAVGPAGFGSDSATANVAVTPSISTNLSQIGAGLQRNTSFSLGFTLHGGTTVRVASADSTTLLVSPDVDTPGTPFFDVFLPNGSTSVTYYTQGVEGVINDSTFVTISAPLFQTSSTLVRVYQPIFELISLNTNRTTTESDDTPQIRIATPTGPASNTAFSIDQVRAGGPTYTFSMISDSAAVLDLITQAATADSVTLTIGPRQSATPIGIPLGGVAVRSTAPGVTTLRVTSPQLRATPNSSRVVTVTQSSIVGTNLGPTNPIGRGLMRAVTIQLSNTTVGNPLPVTVTASRPGLVLLSGSVSTLGTPDSTTVSGGVNLSTASVTVQVLETAGPPTDTLTLTFTAPGYLPATSQLSIVDPVLEINTDLAATGTTSSNDDVFTVETGSPSGPTGTTIVGFDNARVGGPGILVNLVNDSVAVGDLVTTSLVADSVQVTIPPGVRTLPAGVSSGGIAFRHLAAGVTTIRANSPLTRALSTAVRTKTVTAPAISSLTGNFGIGAGLQRSTTITLDSPAPAGGLPVTFTADVPGVLLFAPTTSSVGSDTLVFTVPAGSTTAQVILQALDVSPDTVVISATSPGWTGRTATIFVWQPVIQISALLSTMNSLAPDDGFVVQIGSPTTPEGTTISTLNPRRFGAPPLPVTVVSSNGLVGRLVVNDVVADTHVVSIAAGANQTPGTAPTGVFFRPLTTGTTVVSATAPGTRQAASAAGTTVTVTTPGITMNAPLTVGAGLQTGSGQATVSLAAAQHGGVTLIIRSSNPAVARVALNVDEVATDSIVVAVPNGTATVNYVIAGMETDSGAVQISAQASGFTDGTTTATVVSSVIDISSTGNTIVTGSADRVLRVRVGPRNALGTALLTTQLVRAGGTPVVATITSSNPTAMPLITSTTNGATATTTIPIGATLSPSSVALGGFALRPLASGVSTLNVTAPGYSTVTASSVTITAAP